MAQVEYEFGTGGKKKKGTTTSNNSNTTNNNNPTTTTPQPSNTASPAPAQVDNSAIIANYKQLAEAEKKKYNTSNNNLHNTYYPNKVKLEKKYADLNTLITQLKNEIKELNDKIKELAGMLSVLEKIETNANALSDSIFAIKQDFSSGGFISDNQIYGSDVWPTVDDKLEKMITKVKKTKSSIADAKAGYSKALGTKKNTLGSKETEFVKVKEDKNSNASSIKTEETNRSTANRNYNLYKTELAKYGETLAQLPTPYTS